MDCEPALAAIAAVILAATIKTATFPAPALAQEAGCTEPVSVEVMPMPQLPVEFDRTFSSAEIRLQRSQRGEVVPPGLTFGYYEATAGSTFDADVSGRRLDGGRVCLALKALRVRFGFGQRRVLLARELKDYPCFADHVIRHERGHVALDDALVFAFLPRAKLWLERGLTGGQTATGVQASAGAKLKEVIEARLAELRRLFVQERTPLQAALDNEDGVSAMSAGCRAELRRLLSLSP